MATLILNAVGTAVLGPIGGAIGAILGQQIDNSLFGPKGREGPRLNDLSVQTSAYGTPIPKIFGTMRVAGTVVWSTDLREDRTKEGGGKGRPSTTTYSYSVSFAVALSGRPITAIRRIWADGKLLRGEAGDFKTETDFRFYAGGEDQPVDPLIASAEGASATPAYRGMALAVFENLQLADFGNRIPSLTFEIEAESEPVSIDTIVSAISNEAVRAEGPATLTGYSAHGESIAGAVSTLFAAIPHSRIGDEETIRFAERPADPILVSESYYGAHGGERGGTRVERERRGADATATEIALRHYEPSRDYQAGMQRARFAQSGDRSERIDFPAALTAQRAKAIVEARLERQWRERSTAKLHLPWRAATIRPGDSLSIVEAAGRWRVTGTTLEKMVQEVDLVRAGSGDAPLTADTADAGRAVADPDLEHGMTILHLLDIPAIDDALHAAPRLLIAAAGDTQGWRHAALEISLDGGNSYEAIGSTAPPAVLGSAATQLLPGQSAMFDHGEVEVQLLHDAMWPQGCSDDALIAGRNLALLGDELIQFGTAESLGGDRFRLGRLLRGRRGTEWAMEGHAVNERFVLLDDATLMGFDVPPGTVGADVVLAATGIGDDIAVAVESVLDGASIRPPAPVHLTAVRMSDGGVRFEWVRRSRLGWAWTDGGDVPLAEEAERWFITITPDIGSPREIELSTANYLYGSLEQAADGASSATEFSITVVQLGALAPSSPAAEQLFQL